MADSRVKIIFDSDSSSLVKVRGEVSEIVKAFKELNAVSVGGSAAVAKGYGKVAEIIGEVSRRHKKSSDDSVELEKKRAQAAVDAQRMIADGTKKFAELRAEYEKKSLDEVRQAIHQYEQDFRVISSQQASTKDKLILQNLAAEKKAVSATLQLYRSLEKDKIGRTFSEQLERQHLQLANFVTGLESKKNSELRALRSQLEQEVKASQARLVLIVTDSERKQTQEAIEGAEARLKAVKVAQAERGAGSFKASFSNSFAPSAGAGNLKASMGAAMGMAAQTVVPMGGVTSSLAALGPKGMAAAAAIGATTLAIKESVGAAMDYETALADLQAITGLSSEQTAKLGDDARDLAVKFGTSATDIVETSKLLVSALGPELAKNGPLMKQATNDVLTLAKASGLSAQDASRAITTTLGQYQLGAEETTRIANVLAKAAQVGNAEVPDLADGMKVAGTVAKQFGVSVEESAAALEVLAASEIKGAEGGTGFRNVMLKTAAGSKEAEEALKGMGLTFQDINPEKVGLAKGMETLKAGFDNIKDPVERASAAKRIFGMENIAAANALMSNVPLLKQFTKEVTGSNAAQEQASIKMSTLSERFNQWGAILSDVALSIGNFLMPAIHGLMDAAETIAPILVTAIKIAFIPLRLAFEAIAFAGGLVWEAISAIVNAIAELGRWVIDAVTSVGNFAVSFLGLENAIKSVVKWLTDAYNSIKDVVNAVGDFLGLTGDEPKKVEVQATVTTTTTSATVPDAPTETLPTPTDGKGKGKSKKQLRKEAFEEELSETENHYKDLHRDIELKVAKGVYTEEQGKLLVLRNEIAKNLSLREVAKEHAEKHADIRQDATDKAKDFDLKYAQASANLAKQTNDTLEKIEKDAREKRLAEREAMRKRLLAAIELDTEAELHAQELKHIAEQSSEQTHQERIYQIKRQALLKQVALMGVMSKEGIEALAEIRKLDRDRQIEVAKDITDTHKEEEEKKKTFLVDATNFTTNFLKADGQQRKEMVVNLIQEELTKFVTAQAVRLATKQATDAAEIASTTTAVATGAAIQDAAIATTTATTVGAMGTIGAAATPAATAVSVATLGGGAASGIGALLAALAAAVAAFAIPQMFSEGGPVQGPGTETSDSIPARLSRNEFVVRASSVKNIGVETLEYINERGKLPGYVMGGLVGGAKGSPRPRRDSGYVWHINDDIHVAQPRKDSGYVWHINDDHIRNSKMLSGMISSPRGGGSSGDTSALLSKLDSLEKAFAQKEYISTIDQYRFKLSSEVERLNRKEKVY